jgi:hypothetical protein
LRSKSPAIAASAARPARRPLLRLPAVSPSSNIAGEGSMAVTSWPFSAMGFLDFEPPGISRSFRRRLFKPFVGAAIAPRTICLLLVGWGGQRHDHLTSKGIKIIIKANFNFFIDLFFI